MRTLSAWGGRPARRAFPWSSGLIQGGAGLPKERETALDAAAYAAQIACQLGAHIVKVKPPRDFFEKPMDGPQQALYEKNKIQTSKLSQRARHVIQSAFDGKRIVIFSGGPAKKTEDLLEEVRQLARGGAFGSIVGRNVFQRPEKEALELLAKIIAIYKKAA